MQRIEAAKNQAKVRAISANAQKVLNAIRNDEFYYTIAKYPTKKVGIFTHPNHEIPDNWQEFPNMILDEFNQFLLATNNQGLINDYFINPKLYLNDDEL